MEVMPIVRMSKLLHRILPNLYRRGHPEYWPVKGTMDIYQVLSDTIHIRHVLKTCLLSHTTGISI